LCQEYRKIYFITYLLNLLLLLLLLLSLLTHIKDKVNYFGVSILFADVYVKSEDFMNVYSISLAPLSLQVEIWNSKDSNSGCVIRVVFA